MSQLNAHVNTFIKYKKLNIEFSSKYSDWQSTHDVHPVSFSLTNMETDNFITKNFPSEWPKCLVYNIKIIPLTLVGYELMSLCSAHFQL